MQTVTHHSSAARTGATAAPTYPPLVHETRSHVPTACAAWHLNRQPKTMRIHACMETGPIRPLRINGRLAWPVADIKALLGVA